MSTRLYCAFTLSDTVTDVDTELCESVPSAQRQIPIQIPIGIYPFYLSWSLSLAHRYTRIIRYIESVCTCNDLHRDTCFLPFTNVLFTYNDSAHISQANDSVQLSYYIRNGGDPNMTFHHRDMIKTRFTILHMCCQKGHYECAKYLIEHGECAKYLIEHGKTL